VLDSRPAQLGEGDGQQIAQAEASGAASVSEIKPKKSRRNPARRSRFYQTGFRRQQVWRRARDSATE
jgi:hypothetical protein